MNESNTNKQINLIQTVSWNSAAEKRLGINRLEQKQKNTRVVRLRGENFIKGLWCRDRPTNVNRSDYSFVLEKLHPGYRSTYFLRPFFIELLFMWRGRGGVPFLSYEKGFGGARTLF